VNDVPRLAGDGRSALDGVEVLAWSDALPELRDAIVVDDGGNYVFNVFIFLLISFTVMNTLLMSVLERSREFSLLDALGLTPLSRFGMVMLEALMLSLLSILGGVALGYLGHLYLKVYGLPLDLFYSGDITAAGVIIDPVLYSDLTAARIIWSMTLVAAMTIALALVPAFRAGRSGNVQILADH
jgi:ABC-type lipoprotein release transport system permease subunit